MASSATVKRVFLYGSVVVVAAGLLLWRSAVSVSEADVDAMIRSGELVGMDATAAAKLLRHDVPGGPADGLMVLETFPGGETWTRRAVALDVQGGVVTGVSWYTGEPEGE